MNQFTDSAYCLSCKGCCHFACAEALWTPTVLHEEIALLVELGLPPALIDTNFKLRAEPCKATGNTQCCLLDTDGARCVMYASRPFECRLYPFVLNREGQRIVLAVHPACPFVGERLKRHEFAEHVKYLEGLLKEPRYKQLIADNPQLVQSYPSVINLFEL